MATPDLRQALLVSLAILAAACTTSPPPRTDDPRPIATSGSIQTPTGTAEPDIVHPETAPPETTPPVSGPTVRALPGAVASPGCKQPVAATGDQTVELMINGEPRGALVHAPPRLAPGIPMPLVLVFHGTLMDGPQMVEVTGFSERADKLGFLVAYPSAVGEWLAWNATRDPALADDLAFERALVDEIEARYCVDQHRVYAAGFSSGGAMAQLAACRDRRIVAISLVAAPHGEPSTTCLPRRQVPVVTFHGLLDPLVPWRGGLNPLPEFVDVPPSQDVMEWAETWARNNGCDPGPQERGPVGDWVVPFMWKNCGAPVIVYRLGNGGHNWPGGTGLEVFGTINEIDATGLSFRFFLENALPPEPRMYESTEQGYRVAVPEGWPLPWVGRYGYHAALNGAVTFPVGSPLMLDIWATQIVLSGGMTRTGIPTPGGPLTGRTAAKLAQAMIKQVPGYSVSDMELVIDGEPAVVLEGQAGGGPLPLAAFFTHGDRAFLLFVYHEVPIQRDDRGTLNAFLAGFEFAG